MQWKRDSIVLHGSVILSESVLCQAFFKNNRKLQQNIVTRGSLNFSENILHKQMIRLIAQFKHQSFNIFFLVNIAQHDFVFETSRQNAY